MESEARAFRRGAVRMGVGLALTGLTALLAAAGMGLLLWALFRSLAGSFGLTVAALATGGGALLLAGVLAWTVRRLVR